jgi:hypothetical protein
MGAPGPGQPFALGPLPDSQHVALSTQVVPAVPPDAESGTSAIGPALVIDASPPTLRHYAWARYAYGVPPRGVVNSVSVDVSNVTGEYWVGFSDYAVNGAWEWHGPYTASATPAFKYAWQCYLSPARNLYWVVVAPAGSKLQLNFSTVDYDMAPLSVPPAGEQGVDLADCQNPSLVLLPPSTDVDDGAPLIAYTQHADAAHPKLYFAYYSGGHWQLLPIMPENDYLMPLMRFDSEPGVIVVYNVTAAQLQCLRFDLGLNITAVEPIMDTPVGPPFFNASLDYDGAGELGVAHAYSDDAGGKLFFSWNDGSGWQTSAALHDDDSVGGVSFRYDPAAGQDWLLYTHGTMTRTESTLIIDFSLESGRGGQASWTFTPVNYSDSPLGVHLQFMPSGTPQVLINAARDFHIDFPVSYTASVLVDILVGAYSGSSWDLSNRIYTSTLTPSLSWPHLVMDIAAGGEVAWARKDELIFSEYSGQILYNLQLGQVDGGSITPVLHYRTQGSDDYGTDVEQYFTGSTGRAFSWVEGAHHACAYVLAETLDAATVFSGELRPPNDLRYWSD